MKILNFDLDKTFWMEYLLVGIISSFGVFIIYAKNHNKFTFNIFEFITMLPFAWFLLLIMAVSMGMFISYGGKK